MLNRDFSEFVQSPNANAVRYLVVGGYAVALHGYPRYTKDIDIWVDAEPDNATRLVRALADFGFGSLGLQADDSLIADQIVQLGYPPARIDLLTSLPGVEFAICYAQRVTVDMHGVAVDFISRDCLRANKAATGRAQDLVDLEHLD